MIDKGMKLVDFSTFQGSFSNIEGFHGSNDLPKLSLKFKLREQTLENFKYAVEVQKILNTWDKGIDKCGEKDDIIIHENQPDKLNWLMN